jgi:hypothetical protein
MYEQSSNDFATGYAVGRDSNNCGYGYGNGMFGGDFAWWIIILLLFGWGNNGYGFGGGFGGFGGSHCGSACATQADLAAGFNNSAVLNNLNDLKLGQAGIQQTLCQGFNGVNTAILQGFNGVDNAVCTLGYNIQGGFNALQHSIDSCCCTTQRSLDSVKYENAKNTCDIIRAGQDNTRAILDFLTQDKISTLTAENQSLKFAASQSAQNAFITANQEAQTAELIRRLKPEVTPAYVVPNPNCCYNYGVYATNPCNPCGVAIQ